MAVPAGAATNEYMGNHSWTALSFAVHGLTNERRFAKVTERVATANDERELNLPTVAAMCGGNTPALLSREHHAFVTYAVAVADRAEADAVMRALKSEEAAQFTARALRVGDGARVAVRDVIYKMAPRGATRGNEDAPASVWANPNVSPPPPPVPAAPDAPPAPSAPSSPAGAPRKVLVTVAAPTDAVSSPDAKRAAEKAREAKEALARAADTSDEAPFWNGLADAERDVDIDRLEFNFVAEVVVAGDEAVDVDLLCDAVAADLGARAETSRCALVSTAALGVEKKRRKRKRGSAEREAEAERLRVKRAEARRRRRRERTEARDQAEDELFQRELERSAAAEEKEGNLGAEGASAKTSPETRLVFSVRETPDRASLDALTAAALNSANDFPTASAVCGGRAVTMEYAHSRAEVTFAVWTTSQQVAATVRAAVAADAFIEEFAFELGGECELRDALPTSSASRARRTRRPRPAPRGVARAFFAQVFEEVFEAFVETARESTRGELEPSSGPP